MNNESSPEFVVAEKPLSVGERAMNSPALRKSVLLVVLAIIWQVYATWLDNALLFPKFSDTVMALFRSLASGELPRKTGLSLWMLMQGYLIGLLLAGLLTALSISTRVGNDLLETLAAMFNPLPAIALLPLALIWFGLGTPSIVFVVVHSVLWAVALNAHSGFSAVSSTLRMVGRNYGLKTWKYVLYILVPGAFPFLLTGLKVGWAFAWRTLIAAELVFGVSSGQGGLGWFIYENKNNLEMPSVFAGLLTIILIGLCVETLIFKNVENRTVRRWGMQS